MERRGTRNSRLRRSPPPRPLRGLDALDRGPRRTGSGLECARTGRRRPAEGRPRSLRAAGRHPTVSAAPRRSRSPRSRPDPRTPTQPESPRSLDRCRDASPRGSPARLEAPPDLDTTSPRRLSRGRDPRRRPVDRSKLGRGVAGRRRDPCARPTRGRSSGPTGDLRARSGRRGGRGGRSPSGPPPAPRDAPTGRHPGECPTRRHRSPPRLWTRPARRIGGRCHGSRRRRLAGTDRPLGSRQERHSRGGRPPTRRTRVRLPETMRRLANQR